MGFDIIEKICSEIPEGLKIIDKFDKKEYCIAKVITEGEKPAYIALADNNNKIISSTGLNTRFEFIAPYKNIERYICMLFGPSGVGKTIIAGELAKQFYEIHKGKIFFISSKDMNDDKTFSKLKDIVKQVDIHEIYNDKMSKNELREMMKELFSNSLIVFDDNDLAKDEKIIRGFRDLCCEIGRSYNINIVFISHKNADAHKTKIILNELTMYICWKKNLKKNRILTEYYGIDESYLKNINTKSWCLFNFKYSKVITPREIKDFETNQD